MFSERKQMNVWVFIPLQDQVIAHWKKIIGRFDIHGDNLIKEEL